MSSARRSWLAATLVCTFGILVFWLSRLDSTPSPQPLYVTETAVAPTRGSVPTGSAPATRIASHDSPLVPGTQAHSLRVTCRVTVQSKITRQPVSRATVIMLDRDAVLIEMSTNALGQCLLQLPAPTQEYVYVLQHSLLVSAGGFADYQYELPLDPPSELLVLLEPEVTIRGRVVTADNGAPPNQVRVYAWSTADDPSESALQLAVEKRVAPVVTALTDDRGYFTLSRLSSEQQYSLAAGGHGWASPSTIPGVRPGVQLQEITVWRLYGCVVRMVTPDGDALPRSSLYSFSCDSNIPGAVDITFPSLHLRLSGITLAMPGLSQRRGDWRSAFFGCLGPQNLATIGVAEMRYTVPGFAPLAVSIALPAVTDQLSERTCVLRPMTELGILRLRFQSSKRANMDMCDGRSCRGILVSPIRVELRGRHNTFACQINCLQEAEHEIHGVPVGVYKVLIHGVGWRFPLDTDNGFVSIGNEPALYDVPIRELCGTVVLQPEEPLPRQRSASISVNIMHDRDPTSAQRVGFRDAPYMVSGLAPGRYNLEVVTYDLGGRERRSLAGPVNIKAGQIALQRFTWH